jgi:hypothetical protein
MLYGSQVQAAVVPVTYHRRPAKRALPLIQLYVKAFPIPYLTRIGQHGLHREKCERPESKAAEESWFLHAAETSRAETQIENSRYPRLRVAVSNEVGVVWQVDRGSPIFDQRRARKK